MEKLLMIMPASKKVE